MQEANTPQKRLRKVRVSRKAQQKAQHIPSSGVGDDFSRALTMIERLPLSEAEKAEAVRRLLLSVDDKHPQ